MKREWFFSWNSRVLVTEDQGRSKTINYSDDNRDNLRGRSMSKIVQSKKVQKVETRTISRKKCR